MTRIPMHWLAAGLLLAVSVGCSDKKDDTTKAATTAAPAAASSAAASDAAAPAAGGSAVTIKGFAFSPAALTVAVGTTVTVTNSGSTTHTFTSVSGPESVDTGRLEPDASAKVTFAKAGTYAYHCSIHASMTGTVIVS